MKTFLTLLLALGLGGALAAVVVSHRHAALREMQAAEFAQREAAFAADKAKLEKALANARGRTVTVEVPAAPAPVVSTVKAYPAREAIERLKKLRVSPGPDQLRHIRQVVTEFEGLINAGNLSLPAINEFITRNEDLDYDTSAGTAKGKGAIQGSTFDPRNGIDFLMPPSLRLGLFDALRRIGGADSEKILADALGTTGRGLEILYLARVLQEMAPNKYRELAVTAARDLLTNPVAKAGAAIDKLDQSFLFGVLMLYQDASFAPQAQAQLVSAEGKVDRAALKYLQTALGEQSLTIAQQAWADPRIPAGEKEPLARMALAFLGVNPQAEPLFKTAINDLSLPKDHRRELIEDLNTEGFPDKRNPTTRDLTLIQNRLQFIQQNAPSATDPVNIKAFNEANKDLLKMLDRVNNPPPPKP